MKQRGSGKLKGKILIVEGRLYILVIYLILIELARLEVQRETTI